MITANMVYTVDQFTYVLKPVFRLNYRKFIRLVGCELYGRNNHKYYGYWDRCNMPMNLVYQCEQRCRLLYAEKQYEASSEGVMREKLTA